MPRLAKKTQEAEGCLERVLNSLETGFAMGSGGDCSSLLKETHIICMQFVDTQCILFCDIFVTNHHHVIVS